VYPVSNEYIEAIQKFSVMSDWYGNIKTERGVIYYISPSVIVEGTGKITRQICSGEDIQIGTTCSAELDISLRLENVERYELYKATVTLFFMLKTGNTWETVPLGVFTIAEPPERSLDVITIHAYDNMLKFNGTFGLTLVGTPYYMLNYVCSICHVELGSTQEEITNYVNGNVTTYNFEEVEVYTYRDFIGNIASFLCCFAYIGVDGKLYLKPYGMTPDRTITEDWRFEYKPKDYEAYYTSITSYFAVTKEYEQVVLSNGGLDYALGVNPLIQFNDDDVRRSVLTNIISKLNEVTYTPFTAKMPCDPSLMPGDVVNFTGNHAVDGKMAAITKQVITINGAMQLECCGTDPNLNVLTEKEKQIQTAAKNSDKDAIYYYDYANTSEITIADGKTAQIILFEYTTTKKTHIDFHGEVVCQVETTESYDEASDTYTENDGIVEITYREGGDLVTTHYPADLFQDGKQLLNLLYTWWASGNILSTFEVRLKCVGCSITIAQGASRGYIAGIGLVGDSSWDGAVHIYDDFMPLDIGSIVRKDFDEQVDVTLITPDTGDISQDFNVVNFFNTIRRNFQESLTDYGLHRFSVPYNNNDVVKVNVVASGNVWKNEDTTVDGTVTTYDCEVERILRVTSAHNSGTGDVTYLVSFDSGESWYTYADGFTPYESGYGMVEGTMSLITESEWAAMIQANGTIMIKAILQGDATLTDIDIYTYETNSWVSIGPDEAESYNSQYVSTDHDLVQLITAGYAYTGSALSIDSGYAQILTIDTSIFSAVQKIEAVDQVGNILTDEELDLDHWAVTGTFNHTISYYEGINELNMLAASGHWESFILALTVEPNTDYRLSFQFNSPTGYRSNGYEHRRAYVWDSTWVYTSGENSLTNAHLLGYSDVWTTSASETPVDYSVSFNSGNNSIIRIQFGLGVVYDDSRATMVWRDIRVRKV